MYHYVRFLQVGSHLLTMVYVFKVLLYNPGLYSQEVKYFIIK